MALQGFGLHDLSPVIVPASTANVMRALQFAAVRALDIARRGQGIVRATLVTPGSRHFLLGDRHVLLLSTQWHIDCRFLAKFPYSGKAGGVLFASFYVYWTSKIMPSHCSPFNVLRI